MSIVRPSRAAQEFGVGVQRLDDFIDMAGRSERSTPAPSGSTKQVACFRSGRQPHLGHGHRDADQGRIADLFSRRTSTRAWRISSPRAAGAGSLEAGSEDFDLVLCFIEGQAF
jgi:hypothetical protein